jgi:hypothetical protein
MRRTMLAVPVLAWVLAAASPSQEKAELRYAFKKGETFPLKLRYALKVKLDKVPDLLQGVLSEDPIDLKFEGDLDVEVLDVSEDGVARLRGTWKTAKAKGHMMVNDVDFAYDASKPEAAPAAPGDDPALQGFMDVQDQMRRMVREPLRLDVDRRGQVQVAQGGGRLGELEGPFRSLNGLAGPFPEKGVGLGDAWSQEVKLGMPGVGGNVDLKVSAANKVEAVEGDDLLIASTYKILQKGDGEADAGGLNVKMKTEGEGSGKLRFAVKGGRARSSDTKLQVRISAVVPNPGGGEDIDLKASLRMEMGHEILK